MDPTGNEFNHINEMTFLKQKRERRRFKYATVEGSLILALPNNLTAFWGNLSVYSLSFLVSKQRAMSGAETTWVFSAFLVFWTIASIISGLLARRLGRPLTIFIGALTSSVAIFMSYFAIQESMIALTVTSGMLGGLGAGLVDSSALQLVVGVADTDNARLTSSVLASRAFGALIINQITTFYLNPSNLSPDLNIAQGNVFTQEEILRKVPTFFLILGGMTVSCYCVGLFVLSCNGKTKGSSLQDTSKPCLTGDSDQPFGYNKDDNAMQATEMITNENEMSNKQRVEKTPLEMLKTITFYAVWIVNFLRTLSYIMLGNYYKTFGLIWIPDDHFLTDIGTAMVATNALSMPLTGLIIDKYGVKNCLIVYISLLALFQQWYYFLPMLNKWVYLAACLLLSALTSGCFSACVAAVVFLFGKKHYSINVGILMTAALAFNVIAIFAMNFILSNLQWFGTFTLASGLNLVLIFVVIFFIPFE